MASVELDKDLIEGLARFISDRDEPPRGRMTLDDAVNVIVEDWLMGQGYMPLPGEPDSIVTALDAAKVPD